MPKPRRISYLLPRALIVLHDLTMTALLWTGLRMLYTNENINVVDDLFYRQLSAVVLLQAVMLWWSGLYLGAPSNTTRPGT